MNSTPKYISKNYTLDTEIYWLSPRGFANEGHYQLASIPVNEKLLSDTSCIVGHNIKLGEMVQVRNLKKGCTKVCFLIKEGTEQIHRDKETGEIVDCWFTEDEFVTVTIYPNGTVCELPEDK